MAPLSPAQAANKIKPLVSEVTWKNLSALIDKKPGKPQLVNEANRKPAINLTPDKVFTDTSFLT